MNEHYPFVNPPLPYAYSAMEPFIDTKTMELHHNRHLQTYIDNLNKVLADYPVYQNLSLEQLILSIDSLPESIQTTVKNNAGGVYNHFLYFENLSNPTTKTPGAPLMAHIAAAFGSFEAFKKDFTEAAMSVFGSGYAWLVFDAFGKLKIITTKNQDTPLPLNMYPLLNLDVWEHAYYLKNYNMRADYISSWFEVVNWAMVNEAIRAFSVGDWNYRDQH